MVVAETGLRFARLEVRVHRAENKRPEKTAERKKEYCEACENLIHGVDPGGGLWSERVMERAG